jgi:hypothetical protein
MSYKIVTIVAILMLAACNAKHADLGQVFSAEQLRDVSSAHQVAAAKEHSASKPQPKPGAQISLVENQVYVIEPGEQANINIRLRSAQQQGQMRVTVSGSEGLNILAGATEQEFSLASDIIYELPLQLLATQPGRYYAHIKIVIDSDGRQLARVISAIVQAGKTPSTEELQKMDTRAGARTSKETGDEQLIIQPARETILH